MADTDLESIAEPGAAPAVAEAPAPSTGTPAPAAVSEAPDDHDWDSFAKDADRDSHTPQTPKRHRARSQQATPADVPRIQELTRKLREVERERDALKGTPAATPAAGSTATEPAAPVQSPAPPSAAVPLAASVPPAFPQFDAWAAQTGNDQKSYDDYLDARADWRYQVQSAQQRAADYQRSRGQAMQTQMASARTKYPDFDAVVFAPQVVHSDVMFHAIMASDHGADIAYALGKDPQRSYDLAQQSHGLPASAIPMMRQLLESLVASEQRSAPSQRPQAAQPTGSALALVPPPAPKPPTPVRTSALKATDDVPGDDSDLEAHAKAFGSQARRRR